VDFAVALPVEWKIRDGWSKYALRLGVPELPAGVRWRRDKQGFVTPEERWLKQDFAELIRSSFRGSRLGELGMIDEREFLHYYEKFQNGDRVAHTDISRALVAELWARKYLN
jgi:asparagine synthase (glutamine-hydrolysing)